MLRRDRESTQSMPRGLLAIAGLLLVLRIVAEVVPERHEPDLVAWQDPAVVEPGTALAEAMPVLYYYSASWCQPCRRLDADVFHDDGMAGYVNARFVPVRVMAGDGAPADRPPEVKRLMESHGVRAFPTLVIERAGQEPLVLEGYPSRRKVLTFLHSILPPKP